MANLPDQELGTRLYHIHLTYPDSPELKKELTFRNYLRTHPQAVDEYAQIKMQAAKEAQKYTTKNEMRDIYGKIKETFAFAFLQNEQF